MKTTTMKTVELPYEMIDRIVVDELKDALLRNIELDRNEDGQLMEPDRELIDALKTVIMYFAPRSEYEPFLHEIALTQMVRESELLGLYDEQPYTGPQRDGS